VSKRLRIFIVIAVLGPACLWHVGVLPARAETWQCAPPGSSEELVKLCAQIAETEAKTKAEEEAAAKNSEAAIQADREAQAKAEAELKATEAKFKAEREAQTREAEAAAKSEHEAEAKTADEEARPPFLRIHIRSVFTPSFSEPGATIISIDTPGTKLVTSIHVGGGTVRLHGATVVVPWTCNVPGTRYGYTITAGTTQPLTRRGHFWGVSRSRCKALYASMVVHRQAIAGIEKERLARFEYNCRKLGGTPISLTTSRGRGLFCRSPNGGIMLVPH
jgi:hypothetical protein